ncbi:hypothetical protein BJV78DRAFT_234586 [Lactifluus subvellereus]|nr:hypothetical protein BJV78DRAFT_234586 [Lactifluus subvellereus]
MLCNWSTKANVVLPRIISFGRTARKKILELNNYSSYHSSSPPTFGAPTLPQPRSHPAPSTIVPPPSTTPSSFILEQLTPAQISRASATAIRISVGRGAIWDGFHMWHSLHWSARHYYKHDSNSAPQPPFRSPITSFVPIDFGRPVSTRLAGHCLLHGLLRAGETKAAAKLTEQMMAYGEELRPLSFNILLRQLHPSASPESPRPIYNRLRNLVPRIKGPLGPKILELQNVMPADPLTRFAVRLLHNAREHRWQRTTGMYESVLRACLVQGEILVASLLLALLLKDYQLRQACSRVAAEAERVGAPDTMAFVQSKIPEAPSRSFKLLPYRNSHFLFQSVTKFLEKHCAHVDDPLFHEASQALANVAGALDARKIPYANLATLIKVLYSYPQCQHNVWITLPSGERRSCNAFRYFHGVLFNLLSTPPDRRSLGPISDQLPALNLESYNALLNYAMRFRHSLTLADRVLHHMTESRKPPLAPNMTTYNILLRGSTLMRRNDITESILRMMRRRIPGDQVDLSIPHFPPATLQDRPQNTPNQTNSQFERNRRRFRSLLEDTCKYELTIPKPKGLLEPDNALLTTYMAHLVATGRPDAVAILITRVIPGMELPNKSVTHEELISSWHTSVARGVALGPHFFAVALNALRKAGQGGLAGRVWTLARAAEEKSLQGGSTTPWCLSVHAYTAMLQLYADETRGWQTGGGVHCRGVMGAESSRLLPCPRNPRRAMSALRKGMQIFRALPLAADKAREAAVRARNEGWEWKTAPAPPTADARFYNAALSLVSRWPGMAPRSAHPGSRWRWNRMLGRARQQLLFTGHKPRGWTPELEEIAKSVRSAGYALPVGFKLRLVGRDEEILSEEKMDLDARPYSFGRRVRSRFAPHRIPTVKRKGLPLRGRWRSSGWLDKDSVNIPKELVQG